MKRLTRGWWGMHCWNGLSAAQRTRLIEVGNLAFPWIPEGDGCPNGAEVAIETQDDVAPGPRFYCRPCAIEFLKEQATATTDLPDGSTLGA
jgi:hypothetical protein